MKRFLAPSLLMMVLWCPLSAESTSAVDARLTQAIGDVILKTREGNAKGPTVQGDMTLEEGDRIHVGPASHAEICVDGKTLVRLEPDSDFKIKHLSPNNILFGLGSGTLLAKVKFDKREGSRLAVETSEAIASVHGTEFVVEVESWGSRVGVLDEGHVGVAKRSSTKEVLLHFNQETRVRRGHRPEKAHILEHLYSYKIPMSNMRDRLKIMHNQWNTLTPEQRLMVRQAWIKTHTQTPPQKTHPHKRHPSH